MEQWTTERVAKFIDLLGYREITLKSDTEPAIIAFRHRVAEMCKAEVTTEEPVKGDKESKERFLGNADGVFRAREIRRLEPQSQLEQSSHEH